MRLRVRMGIISGIVAVCALNAGAGEREALKVGVVPIGEALRAHRWIAYCPVAFRPGTGTSWLSLESVAEDLRVLRGHFDGLITYGSVDGTEWVPVLARECGFKACIVGVWDPKNTAELRNVEALARLGCVTAVCMGNEGLLQDRYTWADVTNAAARIRQNTGLPVSTSEPIDKYGDRRLATDMDFLLPNIHPFWQSIRSPTAAVEWVERRVGDLREAYPDKPILVKETGYPSAGPVYCSEDMQAEFWKRLLNAPIHTNATYAVFEAFDAGWKHERSVEFDVGPHWGLWTSDRKPKKAVAEFPALP